MTYDLGDPVALSVTVRDATGAPAAAGAVALTVTLPDGTTASPAVSTAETGVYTAVYVPAVAGVYGYRFVATGSNACAYADGFTVAESGVPLVSLADAKARLNMTGDDHDEELRRVIVAATGRASREVGRRLRPAGSITQTVDMTCRRSPAVVVPTPTLLSVTSVTQDGTTVDAGDYEMAYDGQSVRRRDGSLWSGVVAITGAVGVAGDDLAIAQQAVLELTAHLWETQRVPMGRNTPNTPTPGMGHALPYRVTEMLEPLRLGGFA